MYKTYIKPPLVLTVICVIVCSLLVFAYNLTYVDTTGQLTGDLEAVARELYPEGDFSLITTKDDEGNTVSLSYKKVPNIVHDKASGNYILEVVTRGYTKDGIDVMVGITPDGVVTGVAFVAFGDTPGKDANINTPNYLNNFVDKSTEEEVDLVDTVSEATYSSDGVKTAVKTAIEVFTENKEAITVE